jgi:spore coat protein CotH
MKNIFKKNTITTHFFDSISINIKNDLYNYLYYNLEDEKYNILRWDLSIALTTNVNEE